MVIADAIAIVAMQDESAARLGYEGSVRRPTASLVRSRGDFSGFGQIRR